MPQPRRYCNGSGRETELPGGSNSRPRYATMQQPPWWRLPAVDLRQDAAATTRAGCRSYQEPNVPANSSSLPKGPSHVATVQRVDRPVAKSRFSRKNQCLNRASVGPEDARCDHPTNRHQLCPGGGWRRDRVSPKHGQRGGASRAGRPQLGAETLRHEEVDQPLGLSLPGTDERCGNASNSPRTRASTGSS